VGGARKRIIRKKMSADQEPRTRGCAQVSIRKRKAKKGNLIVKRSKGVSKNQLHHARESSEGESSEGHCKGKPRKGRC